MTETPQTTRCRVRINVTGQGQHQCEEPAVEGGYCAKHQSAFSRHLIPPVPAPSVPAGEPVTQDLSHPFTDADAAQLAERLPSAPARAGEPTAEVKCVTCGMKAEYEQRIHADTPREKWVPKCGRHTHRAGESVRALAPATAEPTAVRDALDNVIRGCDEQDFRNLASALGLPYSIISIATEDDQLVTRILDALLSRGSGPVEQGAGGEVTPEMVERFRRAKFCEAHQDREFKYGRVNIDTNIEVALKCDACIATALRAALAVAPDAGEVVLWTVDDAAGFAPEVMAFREREAAVRHLQDREVHYPEDAPHWIIPLYTRPAAGPSAEVRRIAEAMFGKGAWLARQMQTADDLIAFIAEQKAQRAVAASAEAKRIEITDAMVERAAQHSFAQDNLPVPGDLQPESDSWEDVSDAHRESYRRFARAILTAAHASPESGV